MKERRISIIVYCFDAQLKNREMFLVSFDLEHLKSTHLIPEAP